ncbi:uncharacterized protein LOC126299375 [Schistocerca gregaria]|uniref:uncharacterized protein LOC126299375 n=1 Tax=Schistocerca gregaria TaxID=7010 RepID=UPI00211EBA03|nr:uncharacterized protein LOC126299375 [Schistocerca gregaria]
MSWTRFFELTKILRFDDKNTREIHRQTDKFAPMREIFESFNSSLPLYFIPDLHTTVDEMLSLFRGRCPFKVFLKEKPGKYGILIRMLSDSETRYVISMDIYTGKSGNTQHSNGPMEIVKRLIKPIEKSGRNVTTDRYYTSVELAETLWNDFHLTLVGTLQSNRRHIPEELKTTTGHSLHSSIFAYTDPQTQRPPVTLASTLVREKPKRLLLMLSTYHSEGVLNEDSKKTNINLFYNSTKGGVDTIDQMARHYSTKRGTRRWPLSLFYTLIDIAAINAYSLFLLNFPNWKKNLLNRRRVFITNLGLELIRSQVDKRAQNLYGLQKPVIMAMESITQRKLSCSVEPSSATAEPGTRGWCHLCCQEAASKKIKYNKLGKSTVTCSQCHKHVCGKHCRKTVLCEKCVAE